MPALLGKNQNPMTVNEWNFSFENWGMMELNETSVGGLFIESCHNVSGNFQFLLPTGFF